MQNSEIQLHLLELYSEENKIKRWGFFPSVWLQSHTPCHCLETPKDVSTGDLDHSAAGIHAKFAEISKTL